MKVVWKSFPYKNLSSEPIFKYSLLPIYFSKKTKYGFQIKHQLKKVFKVNNEASFRGTFKTHSNI